jgi:hypothetical protein
MIQTTITIIIVLAAAMIALIRFVRFFTVPLEKCGGCSQSGDGCSLEDLKKEIGEKKGLAQKGTFTTESQRHRII